MKLCIKYRLNPTKEQEEYLNKLGFYATKLYNTDNYIRREQWGKTGKIPSGYDQKKSLKENHWYRLLPSQTAQAIIKNLEDNYVSWFRLRKVDATANPPMFRNKERLSPLTFYQQFSIDGNKLRFSMSRKFKEENGIGKLEFEICKWREIDGVPKMCNIVYSDGKWMAQIVYEIPDVNPKDNPNIMACDIGIINLIGTVDTNGVSKLFTGKQVLAVQHYFNKEIGKVQSATMKQQKKKSSNAISRMHRKKCRQINQIIHTVSKEVVKDAEKNKVGTIVVGDVKNIRKEDDGSGKNIGKVNNQKLHSWGFAKLLTQIRYKANLSGIRVVKVSERDTSKTCSVCGSVKKSNRKHRGFYRCKCGNKMNADVNGAANILKKYLRENNISRSIGSVAEPLIWRCNNVVPS
jgi:putative transposase